MLADWDGTLLLVSHDRDFLDRLVTSTIAFEGDGRFGEYVGGYSDWLRQRRPADAPPPTASRPRAAKSGAAAGPARQASRRQRELDRVIAEIDALETEIATLEHDLSDPALFGRDPRRFEQQSEQLARRRAALDAAEERWSALEDEPVRAGS